MPDLEDCPPAYYESRDFIAYRFVFANLDHTNNFLPALKISPRRVNSPSFASDTARCLGYAFSLFDTLENARQRYRQISRFNRNFHKILGTHIARGQIESSEGLASPPDRHGHISLHEAESVDLVAKFRVVEEI
ncbi:MAG: hypothetical protein KJZ86_18005 [Caldilineaceae bacterium]|nr:hypothetical protein [Caldilineaceae bacterium]HRJ42001.1 hypothetical protein [Caldilineaceae bacterium]